MTALAFLALVVSCVAFYKSHQAEKRIKAAFHLLESRKSRTVTVDHSDGRVTIVKELNDNP